MTWLLSILSWLAGKLFGGGPSAAETAAKEGETAGMARQQATDSAAAARSEQAVAAAAVKDSGMTDSDIDKRFRDGSI